MNGAGVALRRPLRAAQGDHDMSSTCFSVHVVVAWCIHVSVVEFCNGAREFQKVLSSHPVLSPLEASTTRSIKDSVAELLLWKLFLAFACAAIFTNTAPRSFFWMHVAFSPSTDTSGYFENNSPTS